MRSNDNESQLGGEQQQKLET